MGNGRNRISATASGSPGPGGETFSFLVAGHLRGGPPTRRSGAPASTVTAAIDRFNTTGADLIVLLGDNYYRAVPSHARAFVTQFADRVALPVFNAVGNHDIMGSRALYEDTFGPTFFDFRYGGYLFVILDTELSDGSIRGSQLRFFRRCAESAATDPSLRGLFVFSHRQVWAVGSQRYDDVSRYFNNPASYSRPNNFQDVVAPLLRRVAQSKSVVWFSGDSGCRWPLHLLYDQDPETGATYVISGIGDTARDAVLQVVVNTVQASIRIVPVSLTGQEVGSIESYDLEYWRTRPREYWKRCYAALPDTILKPMREVYRALRHAYFWVGCGCAGLAMVVWRRMRRSGQTEGGP
ncbi:MAG: metallophosphoesterase [Verrucomicrobia bacterium]|nr:metallophosphoesterase [Verrucomicrobiota bacterium]